MKASIYVRISQDRAGERAGVTRQREDCLRRANERGWELLSIHEDNDTSARSGKRRPGFEAMLSEVESGQVGVVIAWALDRLQRSRKDELRLYEACQRHGVTLALVNGADLDFSTAAGRFVADALGSVARLEVELKSDRQRRAQEQAALAGRRSGGRKPFGYTTDGMTPLEPEASAVRAAYNDYLAGVPLAAIARRWNEAGLVSGQAKWGRDKGQPGRWTGTTVRTALKNPRYAGLRAYRGEIVAQAEWPPLVPEETFQATVAKMAALGNPGPRKSPQRLLSGLALCGICGAPAWGGGAARRGMPGYRCSRAAGHFSRLSAPVDDYVTEVLLGVLARPDAVDLLTMKRAPDTDGMHDELSALRSRLESTAVEFADGVVTPAQLRAITGRIRARMAEIEANLADAGRVDVLGPLVTASDVREVWDGLTLERRRAVVDTLATVTIYPPGRGVRTFRPDTVAVTPKE